MPTAQTKTVILVSTLLVSHLHIKRSRESGGDSSIIHAIRTQTGADIHVPSIALDRGRADIDRHLRMQKLQIRGSVAAVQAACNAVARLGLQAQVQMLTLPGTAVGLVLGSRGSTINRLTAETGASIDAGPRPPAGSNQQRLWLTGNPAQVHDATEAIRRIARTAGGGGVSQECCAGVHVPLTCDIEAAVRQAKTQSGAQVVVASDNSRRDSERITQRVDIRGSDSQVHRAKLLLLDAVTEGDYECDGEGCGFRGTFDECSKHEETCPRRRRTGGRSGTPTADLCSFLSRPQLQKSAGDGGGTSRPVLAETRPLVQEVVAYLQQRKATGKICTPLSALCGVLGSHESRTAWAASELAACASMPFGQVSTKHIVVLAPRIVVLSLAAFALFPTFFMQNVCHTKGAAVSPLTHARDNAK